MFSILSSELFTAYENLRTVDTNGVKMLTQNLKTDTKYFDINFMEVSDAF